MTWYGHELVLLISISKAPAWSPSSPAWHHDLHHLDLHQRVAMRLSRRLLLPRLLLTFSDKVKHYIALNDWHAGHTIIKDNSMAPASCRTHRHASRDILYNTWSSHTSHISHHVIGHITSQHTLQKQVRRPLIVVASFTWLLRVSSKNDSYLRKNHNGDIKVAISPSTRTASVESDSTKVGETDTRQPSLCNKVTCQLMEPVSRKRTSKVGPGRFIPQYRRIKTRLRK